MELRGQPHGPAIEDFEAGQLLGAVLDGGINLIDLGRLALRLPEMAFDLPAGARRLLQRAEGYVATLVSGQVIVREGTPTGAMPGRLVRGGAGTAGTS